MRAETCLTHDNWAFAARRRPDQFQRPTRALSPRERPGCAHFSPGTVGSLDPQEMRGTPGTTAQHGGGGVPEQSHGTNRLCRMSGDKKGGRVEATEGRSCSEPEPPARVPGSLQRRGQSRTKTWPRSEWQEREGARESTALRGPPARLGIPHTPVIPTLHQAEADIYNISHPLTYCEPIKIKLIITA